MWPAFLWVEYLVGSPCPALGCRLEYGAVLPGACHSAFMFKGVWALFPVLVPRVAIPESIVEGHWAMLRVR